MREIFEYFGFDTQLLGETRVQNFASRLRKRDAYLRENLQVASIARNCYSVPQKTQEVNVDSMGMNGLNEEHKEQREWLPQPQEQELEVKVTDVSETNANSDTGTLQKAFTEGERKNLLNNPYVANVTGCAVQFTEEFKELAYQEFLQTEKTMREILQEHGIDPEILGSKRIWNFTSKLQEKAKKLQGLGDGRAHNKRRPKCNSTEEKTLAERIRGLEHELAYTRQEVEFLKKTQKVDMEARILWESKHRQKSNSL